MERTAIRAQPQSPESRGPFTLAEKLRRKIIAIPVDHQPRQTIGLAVNQPVCCGVSNHLFAELLCGGDTTCEVRLSPKETQSDLRRGAVVCKAKGLLPVVQHSHQRSRRSLGLRLDIGAKNRGVAGAKAIRALPCDLNSWKSIRPSQVIHRLKDHMHGKLRRGFRDRIHVEFFFVTGGAGFIGSALVRGLLAQGANRVVVVANLLTGHKEKLEGVGGPVDLHEADIRDYDAIAPSFSRDRCGLP